MFKFPFLVLFSYQARDRQKKRGGTKAIRIDAEGDASLEDLTNAGPQGNGVEASPDPEKGKSSSKKVHLLTLYFAVQTSVFWIVF